MSLRLPLAARFRVVNNRDEPVSILTNIEDYVPLHIVGVPEGVANFQKIVPSDPCNDCHPRADLVRRIRIPSHSLAQMLAGNDVHSLRLLHNM